MPGVFLKVRCKQCKNEQIIFSKASIRAKCLVCGVELTEPTGGKAKIKTTVLKTLKGVEK